MNKLITNTIDWIKEDWASNHIRCVLEIVAWFMSVGANVMFMWTVPAVPFLAYLTLTVTSSAIFAWSLWTRGSLGGLANYGFIVTVDTVALLKLIVG